MKRVYASAGLCLLLVATLLGTPITAWAQGSAGVNDGRTYGTASPVVHTLQAFAFTALDQVSGTLLNADAQFGSRFCSEPGPCLLGAPLFLPAGALVTALELQACDTDNDAQVSAALVLVVGPEASASSLAQVSTGIAEQPGCNYFSASLATPHTIENGGQTYWLRVGLDGVGSTVRFQAVRIRYFLQVSPAPATATFNDVPPSHQFFPFIQALAAAGITGGCSTTPPLYCPDEPVTRGQMAVFISRALGLHFAP